MRTVLLSALIALIALPALATERLVMAPYPGPPAWSQVTNQANAQQWLHEQIPLDQRIDGYRDILTSQGFIGLHRDPSDYLRSLFSLAAGACEAVRTNGPKAQTEGGYPVAYAQLYCSRQKGQPFGVVIFYKAIQGAEGLYVVDRDFRVPPSRTTGVMEFPPGQEAQAAALMRAQASADRYLVGSVYVCGARATDPRCKGR